MFFCSKCENNKTLEEIVKNFNKKKHTYYIQNICKSCKNTSGKEYKNCNDKVLEQQRNYKLNNKERIQLQRKEYHKNNKPILEKYKKENPNIIIKCRKNYYNTHKNEIILYAKFSKQLRRCLFRKDNKYITTIGCYSNYFKKWIKSQFSGKMCFENYGEIWELDHVIPQSLFVKEQMLYCHNWRNIRPCLITDNKLKKDKIILYENVLHELKLYHIDSLLFDERNFFERPQLIAVPNSKKEIHRDNPQPSF
jgi:hypothetical protein